MAGDWIKMRMDLHRHPKVVRMASALDADKIRTESGQTSASCPQGVLEPSDRLRIIGGLHAVWCIFDEHSEDGILDGYTPQIMDAMVGWPGFCQAMIDAEWLTQDGQSLVMPNFEQHNGASAKRRASEAGRKRSARNASASCPKNVRTPCGQKADQRREEKSNTPIVPKGTTKGPLQLRAEAIFNRKPETDLTAPEARAFRNSRAAIEATTEADWLLLEAFYRAPQSETFARTSLAVLVNNWSGEIDRARAWRAKATAHDATLRPFV